VDVKSPYFLFDFEITQTVLFYINQVKKKMIAEAKKQDLHINQFNDIKKWWRNAEPTPENCQKVCSIIYDSFQSGWDKELEKEFMRVSKWEYDQESKEEAERCARARSHNKFNVVVKGCIQQTISYIKTDLCNQIRDAGKMSQHGTNITKSRPVEEARILNGKYKKLKKGEFTISQWTSRKIDPIKEKKQEGSIVFTDIDVDEEETPETIDIENHGTLSEKELIEVNMVNESNKENKPAVLKKMKKMNQTAIKKRGSKKENNQKSRVRKKCITPVSSPEYIHVPSSFEKRREAKIARNKQFLKEQGLDLSIGQLSKLYNSKTKKKNETYYVEKIMNHRKNIYKPGEYEVEIKWKGYDNCSNTWEDMREKILEVPDSFLEYYATTSSEFKDDFTVYLELNPELKQKLKWKNSSASQEKQQPKQPNLIDKCDFNHKELKNYISESNHAFCKNGYYLNGKMCSGKCKGLFDEVNKGFVEGQLWIKPSVKAPVWVCQGMVNKKKCSHVLCSDCAKEMMSSGELL